MPPSIANWPEVKATAIATGSLIEAADVHGIRYEAVKMRASREQWPVGRRVHKQLEQAQAAVAQQVALVTGKDVTSVTSAADAAEKLLREGARETRLGLTLYSKRMAERAAETGELEEAPLYKAVADIHAKMHPTGNDMTLRISATQSPVIDIEAEVIEPGSKPESM